jgi:hypothetical protein
MRWHAYGGLGGVTVDVASTSDSVLAYDIYDEPCA